MPNFFSILTSAIFSVGHWSAGFISFAAGPVAVPFNKAFVEGILTNSSEGLDLSTWKSCFSRFLFFATASASAVVPSTKYLPSSSFASLSSSLALIFSIESVDSGKGCAALGSTTALGSATPVVAGTPALGSAPKSSGD